MRARASSMLLSQPCFPPAVRAAGELKCWLRSMILNLSILIRSSALTFATAALLPVAARALPHLPSPALRSSTLSIISLDVDSGTRHGPGGELSTTSTATAYEGDPSSAHGSIVRGPGPRFTAQGSDPHVRGSLARQRWQDTPGTARTMPSSHVVVHRGSRDGADHSQARPCFLGLGIDADVLFSCRQARAGNRD